jgi:hypothetical protein
MVFGNGIDVKVVMTGYDSVGEERQTRRMSTFKLPPRLLGIVMGWM